MQSSQTSQDTAQTTELELRCPPSHRVLQYIRGVVGGLALRVGFPSETLEDIEICVDEACANVIDHAYEPGLLPSPDAPPTFASFSDIPFLSVLIQIRQDGMTLTISDGGRGQDGNFESAAESLEDYVQRERPRGLGLMIIHQFMDEVTLEFPKEAGTRLIMTKRLQESATDSPSPA